MAATATFTLDKHTAFGEKRVMFLTYTVSSYDLSGITLTPVSMNLNYIDHVTIQTTGPMAANQPVTYNWDSANNLILACSATNTAVANAAAFTFKAIVYGG